MIDHGLTPKGAFICRENKEEDDDVVNGVYADINSAVDSELELMINNCIQLTI